MKNSLYIIFSLLFVSKFVNAQVKFPMTDAAWCYHAYGDNNQNYGDGCIEPDTLVEINGKMYAHVIYKKLPLMQLEEIYYREENRKFFILTPDSTNELLVYDFNLVEGDTFHVNWALGLYKPVTLKVTKVDSVNTQDGLLRKKIRLENGPYNGTWVEGVGSINWLFIFPAYLISTSGGYSFTCHYQNKKFIYSDNIGAKCDKYVKTQEIKNDTYFEVSPNPASDQLIIDIALNDYSQKDTELVLYDFTGNAVQKSTLPVTVNTEYMDVSSLPSGIYTLHLKIGGLTTAMEKVVVIR